MDKPAQVKPTRRVTPCEAEGYKVGDQFITLEDHCGFREGETITLFRDDGSDSPLFAGPNTCYYCADGPGAYCSLTVVKKIQINQQEEVVMSKEIEFKVGDKVTVVSASGDGFEQSVVGKTGTIRTIDDGSLPAFVKFEDGSADWGIFSELRLFKEPAPKAITIQQKLEAIDKLTAEIRELLG